METHTVVGGYLGGKRAGAGLCLNAIPFIDDGRWTKVTLSAINHTKMIELCYQAVTSIQVTEHERN
jgi:hypothetical protein